MKKLLITATLLVLGAMPAMSQGTPEDYKRANEIDRLYGSKVFYSDVRAVWIAGTSSFWYRQNTPDGVNFIVVDARTAKKRAAFDQRDLAAKLSAQTGGQTDPMRLPFAAVEFNSALTAVSFDHAGSAWTYTMGRNPVLTRTGEARGGRGGARYWGEGNDDTRNTGVASPDGKWQAFLKNNNMYVRNVADGKETQLSYDGSPGEYYSSNIVWSPDSKKVAVMKIRPAEQRYITFVEAAPESQFQPLVHTRRYAKPGDALPYQWPHIFDVEQHKQVKPDNALFSEPYENLRLRWNGDSRAVTFEYNERGHQRYRVIEVDAASGRARAIVDEHQETFINYGRYFRHDMSNGAEMIWMSERDNHNHLYMYDSATGRVKHQITKGPWYVRQVVKVDEDKKQIIFSANGMTANANEDPYYIRYYRINFDGTGLTGLTPEEGTHTATFSPDFNYLVDVYSKVDTPPVAVLKEAATGKVVMELERADISQLVAAGWQKPEIFTAKGRDGQTDIWGVIVKPSNFDPNKKYPIVEYVYAGPGNQYSPKAFAPTLRFLNSAAELGFIAVMVDGMGTSFRSKAFEDVICKNLKDAGFEDRILWMKAAARRYSYMDIDRVGIYGGSAGGQAAMWGVLFHPEFYKAAYSGCGCHDNRMDKIWWNEQWMGYPIGEWYSESSNVDNAWRLTRPLMLMVGEVDDNVDPATTMQVVKALQRSGKEFELVVVPSSNHTLGGPYGDRKRYDFFVENLLGVQAPDWNNIAYPPK